MRFIGPAEVAIRRCNKEWASLAMDLAKGRRARLAAVRDAVHDVDADSARAGWMSSRLQVLAAYMGSPDEGKGRTESGSGIG